MPVEQKRHIQHYTEEIHIPPQSHVAYIMGESTFEVEGPGMVRIPAETPHTFLNIGDQTIRSVCFFPSVDFWNNYVELGPNPLLNDHER